MTKKIRLLSIIPNRDDATSFYRAIGPLTDLTRRMPELEVMEPSKVTWAVIAASCDVLFMQRPFSPDHLTIAQMAKIQGKPIWIDYDDDLFSVPRSNPAFRVYGEERVQKTIATLCAMADVVTVSTETLHDALQKRGPAPLCRECVVIPNSLPMHIIPRFPELPKKRNPLVMWRGSHTHHEDLDTYLDAMAELMREFPETTFHFQGDAYWRLTRLATKNVVFAPPIDIMEYFQLAGTLQPRAIIVPLADNEFNNSKSNIAQLEGLWAGAVPIVPMMKEWTRIGASLTYGPGDQREFYAAVKDAITTSQEKLDEMVMAGREQVSQAYTLDAVNGRRERVIRGLAG